MMPLREAITAVQSGKKQEARLLLIEILRKDQKNVQAWFLLSYAVEKRQQKIDCLHRVLQLEPTHTEARKRLDTLEPITSFEGEPSQAKEYKETSPLPKATDNSILPSITSPTAPNTLPVSGLRLDDLIEPWLGVLTYTERKILDYLYLDANRFSVGAVGRIMGIPTAKVYEISQRVLTKLKQEDAYQVARPLVAILFGLLQSSGKSISESQLDSELRQKLMVQKTDPLGVSRLIFAVEKHNGGSKLDGGDAYSSSLPATASTTKLKENAFGAATYQSIETPIAKLSETPDISPLDEFAPWQEDNTSIEALFLSRRTCHALLRVGIRTVGQLVAHYPARLLFIQNIGPKSVQEVEDQLRIYIAANPPSPAIEDVILSPDAHRITTTQQLPQKVNASGRADIATEVAAYDEKFLPLVQDKSPLRVLGLVRRTYNAIARSGVTTIGQLAALSPEQLANIRNIGEKAIQEIESQLESYLADYVPVPQPDEALQPTEIWSEPSSRQNVPLSQPSHSEELRPARLSPIIVPQILDQLSTAPLNEIGIERLGLSEILCRGLNRQDVKSIEQLIRHLAFLTDDGTIGKPLEHYLTWLAEQDQPVWDNEVAGKGINPLDYIQLHKTSIEELLNQWLGILPQRSREVLALRFGLRERILTLQEVGERIGVTRERARQLEKQALKTLHNHHRGPRKELLRPFLAFLHQSFVEQGGLLSESEIIALLEDNGVIRLGDIDPLGVLLLLSEVDERFKFHKRLQLAALSIYPVEAIYEIQHAFKSILLEKLTTVSATALLEEFKQTAVYEARRAEFPEEFFLACLRVHSNIERPEPGVYALSKWSNKRLDEVIVALRQLGQPAHYSLIAEKANELLSPEQQTTAHNVHAQMGRLPDIFVRVGHGIFGLAEWGLHDDGKVANAAYRVLKEAGRPLHIDVITQEVLRTWHVQPGSVYAAIQNDDRLIGIGSGVYYIREFANETSLPQTDFGTLYGDKLARWQIELNRQSENVGIDTQSEIDAIRSIGLDFFVN